MRNKESSYFGFGIGIAGIFIIMLILLCTSCSKRTHVITEWDGDREIRWYSNE